MVPNASRRQSPFRLVVALLCIGVSGLCLATANIFTQYQETGNSNTPASIGKLFSNSGTCSASVVSGKNIIVTAAHCCYDRSKKDWIGGWSFAPATRCSTRAAR